MIRLDCIGTTIITITVNIAKVKRRNNDHCTHARPQASTRARKKMPAWFFFAFFLKSASWPLLFYAHGNILEIWQKFFHHQRKVRLSQQCFYCNQIWMLHRCVQRHLIFGKAIGRHCAFEYLVPRRSSSASAFVRKHVQKRADMCVHQKTLKKIRGQHHGSERGKAGQGRVVAACVHLPWAQPASRRNFQTAPFQ